MNGRTRRSVLRGTGCALVAALAGCTTRTGPRTEPGTATQTPIGTSTQTPTESTPEKPSAPLAWTFETGGAIPVAPTTADETVFVPSEDGNLYALAATNGQELWRFEAEQPFLGASVAHDGTVIARSGSYDLFSEQAIHALDPETGEERWRHAEPWWLSVLGSHDGTIYVATEDDAISPSGETLYAFDLEDGAKEWTAEIGDASGGLATDDTVYVPAFGRVYAIDAASGDRRWATDVSRYYFETIAEVDDFVCYVDDDGDQRGVLFARDAESGEQRWTFDDWFVSSTTTHDGTLYVGGEHIAAFDLESGTPRWQTDASGFVPSAPVRDGTLYAGGNGSRAIYIENGTVHWSWTPDVSVQGLVPAAADHGAVYFDSYREADPRNRYKFAVEAESGSTRWTFGPDDQLTDLTVGEQGVYVGGDDGIVYGLEP